MKRFFDDWAGENYKGETGYVAMLSDFNIAAEAILEEEILFASYTYECYSGSALIIIKRGGNVYEVNGSHCSCYGLEGQWGLEETTWAALNARFGAEGTDDYALSDMAPETRDALRSLLAAHI